MYFYPNKIEEFNNLDTCIDKYFFRETKILNHLSNGQPIMTQGSCFAVNFAKALIRKNYPVAHLFVNEWINTTHANAIFFNYLNTTNHYEYSPIYENSKYEQDVINFLNKSMKGNSKKEFIEAVQASNVFILTIGVSPIWCNKSSNTYCLAPDKNNMSDYIMKTTSVESNSINIAFILSQIKKINKKINIFLTLSPAPLNATNEYPSIFEADCVSKSTLRLAIDKVMKEYPEINYWPSFEIVRWLGSHLAPVYGSDDGHPRHVSNWLVDSIVNKFIDINGGGISKDITNLPVNEINVPFRLMKNY